MRRRWWGIASVLAIAISLLLAGTGPAVGHEVRSFDACASRNRHGTCARSLTVAEGEVVYLRAEVAPPHGRLEARVTYLRPGAERWRRGVDVSISATGRLWWAFRAEREFVGPEPWRFRFRIARHGKSDRVDVRAEPAT